MTARLSKVLVATPSPRQGEAQITSSITAAALYLELLKDRLLRWGDESLEPFNNGGSRPARFIRRSLSRIVARLGGRAVRPQPFDASLRENGLDWPLEAETMIGRKRLDNIQHCVETVLRESIPGDLIETGVWRGGGSIFMRGVLAAHGDQTRNVWLADSFAGLPPPDLERFPQDQGMTWHEFDQLAVSLDQVKSNFRRYGLLDDRVKFLVGWFKDTLPVAPIERLAVLRLDGDLYASTMDALNALYDKLSPGGFLIVDDYGLTEDTCRRAVHDFRDARGITEPIEMIDNIGAFWRRGF
jgi:O-methyltransferase